MATRDDIKKIVAYLAMAYPNYRPDISSPVNTVDVFLDLLGDLDAKDLQIAVKAACTPGTGRQFAPSADEIRTALVKLQIRVSNVPQAGEAWGAIMESFRYIHPPQEIQKIIDNPMVEKTIRAMGGLNAIGMSEEIMVERAHFLKIYTAFLDRHATDVAMIPEAVEYVRHRQIGNDIKKLTDRFTPEGERKEMDDQERSRAFQRGEGE